MLNQPEMRHLTPPPTVNFPVSAVHQCHPMCLCQNETYYYWLMLNQPEMRHLTPPPTVNFLVLTVHQCHLMCLCQNETYYYWLMLNQLEMRHLTPPPTVNFPVSAVHQCHPMCLCQNETYYYWLMLNQLEMRHLTPPPTVNFPVSAVHQCHPMCLCQCLFHHLLLYKEYNKFIRHWATRILYYHASDKNIGILLDRSWSHDTEEIHVTVSGVEIHIGPVIEFEAWGEQSKMADDDLVDMDLSQWFSIYTDFWSKMIWNTSFKFSATFLKREDA